MNFLGNKFSEMDDFHQSLVYQVVEVIISRAESNRTYLTHRGTG